MKTVLHQKLVLFFSFLVILSIAIACKNREYTNSIALSKTEENIADNEIVIDTAKVFDNLQTDIRQLMLLKDQTLISDTIFGDCINLILNKDEKIVIRRKDVVEKFNVLFSKYFLDIIFNNLETKNNLSFYADQGEGITWIRTYKGQNPLYICVSVPIRNSEFDSSKLYWFRKQEKHWVFCGMTCT